MWGTVFRPMRRVVIWASGRGSEHTLEFRVEGLGFRFWGLAFRV